MNTGAATSSQCTRYHSGRSKLKVMERVFFSLLLLSFGISPFVGRHFMHSPYYHLLGPGGKNRVAEAQRRNDSNNAKKIRNEYLFQFVTLLLSLFTK